uniref:IMD domain-containing protein n=1 Tax=Anas platyrhynchos platyrhynchos TaxID=8840 RepID=A0A493TXM3_ANAPP
KALPRSQSPHLHPELEQLEPGSCLCSTPRDKTILEQFNPALENLWAAEVYFKAIEKIGEQALQSSTSHKLGKALPLPILCTARCHLPVEAPCPAS